jgi:predicted metal-binding protein
MKTDLIALAKSVGFSNAEFIDASNIVCDPIFRKQCESNACGVYGKCWMCPPDIGDIDELIVEVRSYPQGLLYQSIFELEDSFDFEGMVEAGKNHGKRSRALHQLLKEKGFENFLHLSKGGCGVCSPCAKASGDPCRFPEKALSSLEGYGINVSATAKSTSMKYINGVNTVTYFGMILFREEL